MYLFQFRLRRRTAPAVDSQSVIALKLLDGRQEERFVFSFALSVERPGKISEVVEPRLLSRDLIHRIEMTDLNRQLNVFDRRLGILDRQHAFVRAGLDVLLDFSV